MFLTPRDPHSKRIAAFRLTGYRGTLDEPAESQQANGLP